MPHTLICKCRHIPPTQSCLLNKWCCKHKLQLTQICKKNGFLPLCTATMESSVPCVQSIALGCLFVGTQYSLILRLWQQHLASWMCAVCHCVPSTRHTCCCGGTILIFSSSDVLALGINSPGFVIRWQDKDDKDDNKLEKSDADKEATIGFCHWHSAYLCHEWQFFDPLQKAIGF